MFDKHIDRQDAELRQVYSSMDEGVRLASAFEALAKENGALGLLTRYEGRLYRTLHALVARLETLQSPRTKK